MVIFLSCLNFPSCDYLSSLYLLGEMSLLIFTHFSVLLLSLGVLDFA